MGINERDYMRRDGASPFPFGKILLVLAAVILILIIVGLANSRHRGNAKQIAGDSINVGSSEFAKGSLRVNINTATQEELESIPGIGPARAEAIIKHRPYSSVEDLVTKHALGKKLTDGIRDLVKTEGATERVAQGDRQPR